MQSNDDVATSLAPSSVARGSAVLTLSKLLGMGLSFILFLLIARQSAEGVGIFRTVLTYFTFCELFVLLGTHQWLIREIASKREKVQDIFIFSCWFSGTVALVSVAILLLLQFSGVYGAGISAGLGLIALGVPASALFGCIGCVLVGCERSDTYGILLMVENILRVSLGLTLLLLGYGILWVIAAYILVRWLMALLYGCKLLGILGVAHWRINTALMRLFLKQAPVFAMISIAFLFIRYSLVFILPWLFDETAAGYFAVAYQLWDFAMLIPTNFAISSSALLYRYAADEKNSEQFRSVIRLSLQLVFILMIPAAVLAISVAEPMIISLFHEVYRASIVPFAILICSTPLLAADQILSTTMVAVGRADRDLQSVLLGSISICLFFLFCKDYGVSGAALTILAASSVMFVYRLVLLRTYLQIKKLLLCCGRICAATLAMAAVLFFVGKEFPVCRATDSFAWIVLIVIAPVAYLAGFWLVGGLRRKSLEEYSIFLRGEKK